MYEILAAIRIFTWIISAIIFGGMAIRLVAISHPLARLLSLVSAILTFMCAMIVIRPMYIALVGAVPIEVDVMLTAGSALCVLAGVVYVGGFAYLTRTRKIDNHK